MNVAEQIVKTLEERGIKYVFGLPGEENIRLIHTLNKSEKIQFILTQDEQAATFMAEMVGMLTDQPGVSVATLGPGALNMLVGVADAHSHSVPLIAIVAQSGLEDLIKEATQVVDLKTVFTPVTKWSENLYLPKATAEVVNKAYNLAVNGRPGATFIAIPAPFEKEEVDAKTLTTIFNPVTETLADKKSVEEAVKLIKEAKRPVVLAGLGATREKAAPALRKLVQQYDIPVATSFMAKGIIPDDAKQSLGTVGFFVKDYSNQIFNEADVILALGYEFAEFDADVINPNKDTKIIHVHSFYQDTHEHYPIAVNLLGSIPKNIELLTEGLSEYNPPRYENTVRPNLNKEFEEGSKETEVPLSPIQIVHASRESLNDEDIVLVDTGAHKMWMARLFPTNEPQSVLINNGLSSMAWSIPGAIATKMIYPDKKILTVVGDGSFHMNAQELATAKRYNIPMTILVWDDSGFGLIEWKMDMSLGTHSEVAFDNPDFIKLAEAYGGKGYVVKSRNDLENKLKECLQKDEEINIIVAPVDYNSNMDLTKKLQDEFE